MEDDSESTSDSNRKMRQILSEFLTGVVKLEQLAERGRRLLISFQQALEFLKRPSFHETSDLVKSIFQENETKRVTSYVQGGCINAYDIANNVRQVKTSLSRLHDHLVETESVLCQLEVLMDKAGSSLQAGCDDSSDLSELDFSENLERESTSESEKFPLHENVRLDTAGCVSSMVVIYSMVKQDYLMQERVVSSLGLKSSSEELDSYCQMWSLRPFVNDDAISSAK